MSHDRFLQLLSKQFAGTLSGAEKAELQQLLQEPESAERSQLLLRFWTREQQASPDTETALQKLMVVIREDEQPQISPKKIPVFGRWLVAAALVIAAISLVWMERNSAPSQVAGAVSSESAVAQLIEKQNRKGTRSVITLADGSRVWLNADSKLSYPTTFTGDTREIQLSGEAFFDVARNPKKPFIIHLQGGTVRVLGTSFNIKAYPGENRIETSVASGKVAFVPAAKSSDTTFLTQDEKAVYTIDKHRVQTVATTATEDKEWTEGKLTFRSATMSEVALALERYFGKQVVITDEALRDYHLTGTFENNSAEEILYYLSKLKPFTYRVTETEIILLPVR